MSVSNGYNRWSRELIFRFFQNCKDKNDDELRKLVNARCPFRPRWGSDSHALKGQLSDLECLTDPIADGDGKSIPILVKHYGSSADEC